MVRVISVILIFGFVAVDFLLFHDIFKPGEQTTLPQYLTGVLSLFVFVLAISHLREPRTSGR